MLSSLDTAELPLPVIFGLAGTTLKKDEAAFFKDANPLGFILFARNCKNPDQVKRLTNSLRKCVGRDVPILIDQEGGRVMRFQPPVWADRPAAKPFGNKYKRSPDKALAELAGNIEAISEDLAKAGVNVNCAPVLDVLTDKTHKVIGDRAFSKDPDIVAALGKQACKSYVNNGIVPVMKHFPGHGRSVADSHKELPRVNATKDELEKIDYLPFKEVLTQAFSEAVWGMVAHVVYKNLDDGVPSSCSRRVIWDAIRDDIGFKGLLISDDINMEALSAYGDAGRRAEAVLRAGCDVALHCSSDLEEMKLVAARVPKMTNEAAQRYNRTVTWMEQMKL